MAWPRSDSHAEPNHRAPIRWQHRLNRERPNCTGANGSLPRECEWKHGDSGYSAGEKSLSHKKRKNLLDSDRPSHGRPLHVLTEGQFTIFTIQAFSGCALFGSLVWFVSPEAQVLLSSAARGQNCAGRSVRACRGRSIPPSPPLFFIWYCKLGIPMLS